MTPGMHDILQEVKVSENLLTDPKDILRAAEAKKIEDLKRIKAMQEAAKNDPAIAARVKLFLYRVPEEFYDVEADPNALRNLIDDPALRDQIAHFRSELSRRMTSTSDPLGERFRREVMGDKSK